MPASPESPRTARRRAAEVLTRHGCEPALVDDAILLLSEIVTNAVVHADSAAEVEVRAGELVIWFGVRDADSRRWPVHWPVSLGASGGRGLHLVATLAADWGTNVHSDGGKTVWFWLGR
ncbi:MULTISPECIES: ATP-binding protein [unclassified Pseudofrankia]|uniref:ATP-binding protein n=1 Tax=unclassified Pseudofrankia TaxID=2994372 RepID=UPI000E2A05D9|nr:MULTISPECIES: ATP-binding protein [unclassified Pseudofrankia]MDT3444635.1 ATP-binding protein [Pseudofrankia sp. BMG5.37]